MVEILGKGRKRNFFKRPITILMGHLANWSHYPFRGSFLKDFNYSKCHFRKENCPA